jgi:hypothetical protein
MEQKVVSNKHSAMLGTEASVYARSIVANGGGNHEFLIRPRPFLAEEISRSAPETVPTFDFPNQGRLTIGSPDSTAPVIIDELGIDSSGRCCSGG